MQTNPRTSGNVRNWLSRFQKVSTFAYDGDHSWFQRVSTGEISELQIVGWDGWDEPLKESLREHFRPTERRTGPADRRQTAEPEQVPELPAEPEPVRVPAIALALSEEAAAEVLDMSVSSFRRHVRPHVREFKSGRLVRYPVSELERYVSEHARMAL